MHMCPPCFFFWNWNVGIIWPWNAPTGPSVTFLYIFFLEWKWSMVPSVEIWTWPILVIFFLLNCKFFTFYFALMHRFRLFSCWNPAHFDRWTIVVGQIVPKICLFVYNIRFSQIQTLLCRQENSVCSQKNLSVVTWDDMTTKRQHCNSLFHFNTC